MQEVEEVDTMMMEVQGEPNEADSDHLKDDTQLDADEGELLILKEVITCSRLSL